MNVKNINVHELLSRLRSYFLENDINRKYASDEPPLRAELFNRDQLEQHGKYLARTHKIASGHGRERLLKRLAGNEKILTEVRNLLTESIKEKKQITPAGEWLLDNFYLIEDHIRTGKKHLPKGYSESLPQLAGTVPFGLPRVYDIALELISHSDGRIDLESLSSFVRSYQSVTNLQLGELWAIPIMLRLALIENLRRVSARVAIDRVNQNLAGYWASLMMETAEKDAKNLILVVADMARSGPPMESSFVAELIRQLVWKGSSLALPLTWMEQRLSEAGLTSNELVNLENQKQAADQVSVSNCIGSLRFLGSIEWRDFVETMSTADHTLRTDPSGIYSSMDFPTRDRYRHSVEKIAKYGALPENDVAKIAIKLAKEGAEKDPSDIRSAHVGYYLAGEGLIETQKLARQQTPWKEQARKTIKKFPLTFYSGTIILISLFISGYLVFEGYKEGVGRWILVLTGIIAIIGTTHLATTLVNWLVTLFIKPEPLPRLDFSAGIPSEFTTVVIVPTMLVNPEQVEYLIETLEIRFLANRDKNLHFGLLTDFPDAATQTMPSDELVLDLAIKKIKELNLKYIENGDKFFLFHRPRKWNSTDKIWMGYERKRGKLTQLNTLLRGDSNDNFSIVEGDFAALSHVKYIITLDTDTQLPRDAAWRLVGTMAHPLNRPVYDEKRQRITKGYGILQPRVSVSLPGTRGSLYSRIHGNEQGIDPYTHLTSDVYQDLFEEGSFVGKGIYDIDAFERAISGRFPENRILSHDLLEGCYTRSGLLSDVQFYEEYPTDYSQDVNRRHRWIRGDWQIGYWSLPVAPDANRRIRKNQLSGLSRWKIFDNLRRSLVPVALTSMLLSGWVFFHAGWFWTLMVILIVMLPSLIASGWNFFRKSKEITLRQHIRSSLSVIADNFFQDAFMFVCLPYEAFYCLDAILRTGWRMFVSHKKLLEWNPSHNHERTRDKTIKNAYGSMWFSPLLSIIMFFYISLCSPVRLVFAAPILILWMLSPLIAWWLSKPLPKYETRLSAAQVAFLRMMARRTWAFFENFVTAEENWLPPDNYQVRPKNTIAHRTSPTNIGLAFLGNLAAYDFGYITAGTLVERTGDTAGTLDRMERYRGHWYNWYDTASLQPLHPRYVSTVDSGNLAGHLLVLKQGLLAIPSEEIVSPKLFRGLLDTIQIIEKELADASLLAAFQRTIRSVLDLPDITAVDAITNIKKSVEFCAGLAANNKIKPNSEAQWWINLLAKQCGDIHDELVSLFPWVLLPSAPQKFEDIYNSVKPATISEVANLETKLLSGTEHFAHGTTPEEKEWLAGFISDIKTASAYAVEIIRNIERLSKKCTEYADVEYEFLYDKSKHLLTIGYNVEDRRCDTGFYDLLASEARLCSFVAIAQGKLPQENWFALGRLLANVNGAQMLLSWSGSMFEYLMPLLVMPVYENTLLDQTQKAVVARQIEYGAERKVPWGISESGYNIVDANLNYQYSAFGVPGIGLKRGLAEDLVVAPYASMLALMVAPEDACSNIERLSSEGFSGRFGPFEAIDYTSSRLPRGQTNVVIQSYMAHHLGMSLASIAYTLLNQPMQKRFQAELQFQANILLLQERIPQATTYYSHAPELETTGVPSRKTEMRVIKTPHTQIPEIQLLSNGKYHVMVTNAGGGYSRWKDIAVTRWREDGTCDNWGTFCYIRDLEDGTFWSNTHQPTLAGTRNYEATFTQGRAEFRRSDNNIETQTEIVVSPEDDIEMRRIHITNRSRRRRIIDVTSYAEVALNSQAADMMHPVFGNLFVETEIIESRHSIVCTRRPRSADEHPLCMFHLVSMHGADAEEISYETDRMKFIGRGNTIVNPSAMFTEHLSDSHGAVLDPIVSIRYRLTLQPEESVIIDMITGVGENLETCHGLIEKFRDKHHKDRVFELAWTHSQVVLRQINATEEDAQLYGQLASSIIFTNPLLRADASIILKNNRGQPGLWGYSVSGDLPIVLLQIEDKANIELAKQLVQAHAYWRFKGLAADLVIWNEDHGGYRQVLQNQIQSLIAAGTGSELTDHLGNIYVRSSDQISEEDRILFQTVARVNISDKKGSLQDHINRKNAPKIIVQNIAPGRAVPLLETSLPQPEGLVFFNGLGGFSADGREYVITTAPGKSTPAPWVNVLANSFFGAVISESGQSYTWINNAHEQRITPWENDPVTDGSGEAFYIRDEESGYFWSPAPLPVCGKSRYITRHGFGYSVFAHMEDGIDSEMVVYTDIEAPVKFFSIRLANNSGRQRQLSVTGYVEWILGDLKQKNAMHIITETDPGTGALFAGNPYNKEFAGQICFFDTDDPARVVTGDRAEFIGRNGTLKNPEVMSRLRLSGNTGAALDPCGAIQSSFTLENGREHEIVFRLGVGSNAVEAGMTVRKFRGAFPSGNALERVKKYWAATLGLLQVNTPDQAINILTNGWLQYQSIACRLWARSGFYQSGGAYGFRDQLQDVLAHLQTQPSLARKQILLCASRQFPEGDVQHWWHPPSGHGVRTRCSDDMLWLPFVTSVYVSKTGDYEILREQIHFIEDRLLTAEKASDYSLPLQSAQSADLFEHCTRAIQYGLKFGIHGLSLIGSGDWNDGMDLVGKKGNGESVWLSFFLYDTLVRFSSVAKLYSDNAFAEKCLTEAAQLQANIEKNGWDGNWYRRAYFDDGTPLGSAENAECQIDSISQSWAILSGAGDMERSRIALESADKRLVRADESLVQLLDPPFDKSGSDPGYIKGYVPGIRENGGQYTHAAIWMIMAHARLGNARRAWELMNMINPINHGRSEKEIATYKGEPYVMAADVYYNAVNKGRAGWTWYTGSAGWTYQLIVEWLLGIVLEGGNKLHFRPCIPAEWESYKVSYGYLETTYQIVIEQKHTGDKTKKLIVDGAEQDGCVLEMADDKKEHLVVYQF